MRFFTLLLLLLSLTVPVQARSDSTFPYPFSRVWTATVRLLRIDLGCPITEKDRAEGYFLFDYPGDDGPIPGSVEMVHERVKGVEGVKVYLQLSALPRYVEQMVLERLSRKLRAELGEPALEKPKKEAPPSDKENKSESEGSSKKSKEGAKEEKKADSKDE